MKIQNLEAQKKHEQSKRENHAKNIQPEKNHHA